MANRPRLVLFPGLGMDGRTFDPQRAIPADIIVPDALPPEPDETVQSYARRLATTIPPDPRPLFLGGVSIGGAIALEVARHVPCDGVFLIASATTSRALPHLLRVLGTAAPFLPSFLVRFFARRVAPPIVRVLMRKYPAARALLPPAIRDLNVPIWQWGARAIMRWHLDAPPPCPVHHIHGTADPITPIYRVTPTQTVPGGGHMLNVTHPDEVNAFIQARIVGNIVAPPGLPVDYRRR